MNNYITCSKCGITYNPNGHNHTDEFCTGVKEKKVYLKRYKTLDKEELKKMADKCRKLREKGWTLKQLADKFEYQSTGAISGLLRRY